MGTVHSVAGIASLTQVTHDLGCQIHMDEPPFTNALVGLYCTSAETMWKAGIDAISFWGTINGRFRADTNMIFAKIPRSLHTR